MAEVHVDADVAAEGIRWFAGYRPAPTVGPCPHDCAHNGTVVAAWGPDNEHYELVECDDAGPTGCAGRCRGWRAEYSPADAARLGKPRQRQWGFRLVRTDPEETE